MFIELFTMVAAADASFLSNGLVGAGVGAGVGMGTHSNESCSPSE
jgi:hypothetical protein